MAISQSILCGSFYLATPTATTRGQPDTARLDWRCRWQLLLPNALCYFLIITKVTCEWKVKGLPRQQQQRSERTSRAAGVVDKAASASAWAGLGWLAKDMNDAVTDTLKCLLAAATNGKKIAGNNFNCVKCALSFVLSFAIPLSPSLPLYLSLSLSLSNTLSIALPPFLSLPHSVSY